MSDEHKFDYRAQPEDTETSPLLLLSFYWELLRKFYWIILLSSLIAVVAGYVWTKQQPFLYRTESKLIFHEKSNALGKNIERVDMVDPGKVWQFELFWNTQKEVLNSRWFAERVVRKTGILEGDKYIPVSDASGKVLSDDVRLKMAVGRVRGAVKFDLQRDSRVVILSATGETPAFLKLVVDGFSQSYVDYTKEIQTGGLTDLISWFDSYVGNMRTDLEASQTALNKFKRDNDILSVSFEDRGNLTAMNMESVNDSLNKVRNELAREEALAEQLKKMQQKGSSETQAAQFAGSEDLLEMLAMKRNLRIRLAELSPVFGAKHESVKSVAAQLVLVEKGIDEEIQRTLEVVGNRVQMLQRQKAIHQARLDELKTDAFNLNDIGLEYSQMKDHTESLQQLYHTVLERSKELDINSMLDTNTIQILEAAELPQSPFSPNLPMNLLIALGIGLGLGGGIIFLIGALDNTIKGEEDVLRNTRIPLLGSLPELDLQAVAGLVTEGSPTLDMMTHLAPKSSFAEGIKTLRTNLMFISPDNPPAMLLITSPGPGEGKTLLSSNMAIAMAQSGLKTLIVDCDLRRPRVHNAMGIKNTIGVSDVVVGSKQLDDTIQATEVENLFALPAGHIPPNPSELFHSEAFAKLLIDLRSKFDRVLIDSPPVGAVADAMILSRSVDGVLVVLKYGQTRRELFRRSIDQLEAIGAPLMGCILNDVKRNAAGYGYSYYHYRYNYEERPDAPKKDKLAS